MYLMNVRDEIQGRGVTARRGFLSAATGLGAGAALAAMTPLSARAASVAIETCGESVQEIINTALVAERLATTFYYTGLTTAAIVGSAKVAGYGANPNAVSRSGNQANVAYLQAALDQEHKHAQILTEAGATSPVNRFYFPAATFSALGYTSHAGTFLWAIDHLETAFIGTYLAAIQRFGALGRVDLALLSARFLGVECEHRALYRVIAGDDPADNVTLEVADFGCVADATTVLRPFLTGHGFPGGATRAISLPSSERVARVVGNIRSA